MTEPCEHCGGRGWTPVPVPGALPRAQRCSCKQVDLRTWLERVGVPPVVAATALDPWDDKAQRMPKALLQWARQPEGPVGWLLFGAPGRGKSKAAAMALALAKAGRWYETPSTSRRVMQEATELGHSPTRTLLLDQPFAVIDDLGAENNPKLTAEATNWVWSRYTKRQPTIVTSNLKPEQIDQRLMSRMADWRVLEMTGPDYRMARAANKERW